MGAAACMSYTFAESAFDKAVAEVQRAHFDANQRKFLQMTVVSTNFILNGSSKRRIKKRLWERAYWYPISLCCSTHLTAKAWARSDYFLNVLLVYQSGVKHRLRFPQNSWPHWFLCRDTWSKSVGRLKWLTLDKWLFLHQFSPALELTNCYRTPHTPRCVKFKDDIFVTKRWGGIRKKKRSPFGFYYHESPEPSSGALAVAWYLPAVHFSSSLSLFIIQRQTSGPARTDRCY